MVHRALTSSIAGTRVITDLGGRPQFGVRLLIDTLVNDGRVRTLMKPRAIPGILPAGCKQSLPDYDLAEHLSSATAAETTAAKKTKNFEILEFDESELPPTRDSLHISTFTNATSSLELVQWALGGVERTPKSSQV